MEIVLIRHAQPAWSQEGRAVGNPGLTDLGDRQARRLSIPASEWTPQDQPSSLLVVSTMERARQTAAPVSKSSGLPVAYHEWLEEIRPPEHWHGQPVEYVDGVFSDAARRPPQQWWDGFDGGESFRAFHTRVTNGFVSTMSTLGIGRSSLHPQLWELPEPAPARLVVVAHAGTNAVLLGLFLGLEVVPWEWERFLQSHASITRIKTRRIGTSHTFSLRAFSDTRHLQPGEITA